MASEANLTGSTSVRDLVADLPDGTFVITVEDGPAAGRSDTESIQVATVGEDIHFVCWVEKSGVTVSQVIDLPARRVVSFVTYDTPDGRRGVLDRGSIAIES